MSLDPALDLFPLLAGVLAAVSCGVLGNFLVLRRLSLMGDAISHSVLPGLVAAFLLTSTRSPLVMLAGAAVAGVATVVLVELVKALGRVEPGAAMGVVFSVLFALGVLLLEQAAVRHVDLDADCVLHGQLETLVWSGGPMSFAELEPRAVLAALPRQVSMLMAITVLAFAFVIVLFKELRLAAFDPALATSLGYHAGVLHYALMIVVAAATVAAFEAVGSILVIAMLVCPAATARLLTDRLPAQIVVSALVAIAASAGGYVAATVVPLLLGAEDSVNAAGSMAVMAGLLLTVAAIASPRHGVIGRAIRRRSVRRSVEIDHVLLLALGIGGEQGLEPAALRTGLGGRSLGPAASIAVRRGLLERSGGRLVLTAEGRHRAADVARRRAEWETYLIDRAGVPPDHVEASAEQLEHLGLTPAGSRHEPHPGR